MLPRDATEALRALALAVDDDFCNGVWQVSGGTLHADRCGHITRVILEAHGAPSRHPLRRGWIAEVNRILVPFFLIPALKCVLSSCLIRVA